MSKKSTLSEGLKSRLKAYSMTAGAVAAGAVGAQAQIDYTDIDPDAVAFDTNSVFLDLNGDGTDDFEFLVINGTYGSGAFNVYRGFAIALDSNEINGASSSSYLYPYANGNNEVIDANDTFNGGSSAYQTLGWDYVPASSSNGAYNYGNIRWNGGDAYLGLKLNVGGSIHYGWARIELVVGNGGELVVKDYAFNQTADAAIVTPVAPAMNVMGADTADNLDGSDVYVSFDMADDETNIDEYRVFIVKSSAAASFNMMSVDGNMNYTAVSPDGMNKAMMLDASATDADGDAFMVDGEYVAFVYSANVNDTASVGALSAGSAPFILQNPTGIADLNNESVKVYANANQLYIETEEMIEEVIVSSIKGQVVERMSNVSGMNQYSLNVETGIYLVTLRNGNSVSSNKVIIK